MINPLLTYRLKAFIRYLLESKTKYRVHSPFVYDFVTKVLPRKNTEIGAKIEAYRCSLAKEKGIIRINDYGAGVNADGKRTREISIAQAAQKAACPRRKGELLLRIVTHYQPQTVVELGSNLGISGLYLQSGLSKEAQFITIEGATEFVNIARRSYQKFGFNPTLINDTFDDALRGLDVFPIDLVYLDGAHTYKDTMALFTRLLPFFEENGVLIMDDIHWSPDMNRAWLDCIEHKSSAVSIDLFSIGIIFLNRNQAKERFVLR